MPTASRLQSIVTFTTDREPWKAQAMTRRQFNASGLPKDWCEFVWQRQPTLTRAKRRHRHCMDEHAADPGKKFY